MGIGEQQHERIAADCICWAHMLDKAFSKEQLLCEDKHAFKQKASVNKLCIVNKQERHTDEEETLKKVHM